ncbi:MAG TPA: IclR family transcriptional regulator [Syntrophorhabdales bacterium]|nr:IclR family transcriptional regulator [Syntrophorhabdales bacterium]
MDEQKYNVKVLEKTVRILNLYTYTEGALTLDQIAKRAGLSKTTAFRILKTLEKHEIFKYNEREETYSLGLKLMELGGMVYSSLSIRKVASPYLDSLAHSLKATILLGIIKDEHLLYIDKRESESIIRVSSYIGLKRPPYYGMLGMTLVAHMPDEQRKKLLQSYPPEKITSKTVVDVRELMHRFDETKKSGYYVEREEAIDGVLGIGVPIRDFSGNVVAALGACMPVFQVNEKFTQRAIKELTAASASISKELGHK